MYLAPQNIPRAIVLTLGNKVVLYYIVLYYRLGCGDDEAGLNVHEVPAAVVQVD